MENVSAFGDWADAYDARVAYSEKLLDQMVEESGYTVTSMAVASTLKAFMTFSQGFVDMGRLGNGILVEGGWKGAGKDALRALSIVGVSGAVLGRVGSVLQVAQTGPTCVWTSAQNSIVWTGQKFLVSLEKLAKGAAVSSSQLGTLGRADQIVKIQQALTSLGVNYRVISTTGRTLSDAVNLIRSNTGGVVNFSLRLSKAGSEIGGHRLYATFSRASGLMIKDPNCPSKAFRTIEALTKHLKAAYGADAWVMSNSPILFIKNAWLVTASHMAQRFTELSNLALPLIPEIHVVAADAPTAREVVKVQTTLWSGNELPLQAVHVVATGDSLWKLAERYYKQGKKWTVIYAANKKVIGVNPDHIQPGHELMIPKLNAN